MRIVSLTAENVKRLKAVRIEPDGNLVVIGGKNGAGKTSVMDCIQMALGGMHSAPPKPVRKGSRKAEIIAELDGLTVRRTISSAGRTTLEVKNGDGEKMSSPQAVLDKLVGRLSFDPLEFARMDTKRQAMCLRDLVGLDIEDLNDRRQELYDDRRHAGREVARLESFAQSIHRHDDAPLEEVNVSELLQELKKRRDHNFEGANLARESDRLGHIHAEGRDLIEANEDAIKDAKVKVKELQNRAKELEGERDAHKKDWDAALAECDGFKTADVDEIADRIDNAEADNQKVRDNAGAKQTDEALKEAHGFHDDLKRDIERIDEEREARLSAATFPVDGLGFDENGVTMNGLPFEQASDAERLRVSVAMGLAVNPQLKVLLIRDGSLLDDDSLALVAQMAEDADAQVWMERVGEGEEFSVIIEDGEVKA